MEIELKVIKTGKKIPSVKQVATHIEQYEKEHQGKPVFLELLSRMGILWEDWCEMKENFGHTQQVRLLEMYQQHILVQLEKMLLFDKSTINHPSIIFYLKKSNPSRYGDKSIEIKTKKVDSKTLYSELKNESDVDLMKLSVC